MAQRGNIVAMMSTYHGRCRHFMNYAESVVAMMPRYHGRCRECAGLRAGRGLLALVVAATVLGLLLLETLNPVGKHLVLLQELVQIST